MQDYLFFLGIHAKIFILRCLTARLFIFKKTASPPPLQVCLKKGPWSFLRGNIRRKIAKIINISGTTEPISTVTKHCTKHPWWLIQVCSKEGPRHFPKGDNSKHFKIFFWWAAYVKGIQVCWNKAPRHFPRGDKSGGNIKLSIWKILKAELRGQCQSNLTQIILVWWRFIFFQMKGHTIFEGVGGNWGISTIHCRHFFSRTADPISTKYS